MVTENGDVDAELVTSWWEYCRLSDGSREERKQLELGHPSKAAAASDTLFDLMHSGGQVALETVLALLESAPDDDGVARVGPGPLEDLVSAHGDALAGEIEQLASTSPRFRRALSSVYLPEHLEVRLGPLQA